MENQSNIAAPVLDIAAIQKAANEAATKAAIEAINKYYNGYNSKYMEQVREYLEKNCPFEGIELPNFTEMIQKSLVAEINKTAEVISIGDCVKTIRKGLTNQYDLEEDGTMKISNFFKKLADDIEVETDPESVIEISVEKNKIYDWEEIHVRIEKDGEQKEFEITLFENRNKPGTYYVSSMPYSTKNWTRTAKVKYDDGMTIEIPVMQEVINNPVLFSIAKMLLNKTPIVIDERNFYDSYELRHDV